MFYIQVYNQKNRYHPKYILKWMIIFKWEIVNYYEILIRIVEIFLILVGIMIYT